MSLAYSRAPPGSRVGVAIWPLGIWNGVRTVNGKCGTWVPPTRKRDATTPDECSINTSLTSSTAITAQTSTIPPLPASTGRLGGQIFTNITVAPSSIILGFNRTSMLKAIVSKLREMCDPANTVCTEYGEIDNVYSFFANTVTKGTLNVKIPESSYNNKTRAQRDGLVLRAGQAMSASGSNCATHLEEIGNCPERREVGDASACEVTHVDVCHYTDSVDVVVFQDDVGLIAQMVSGYILILSFDFSSPSKFLHCCTRETDLQNHGIPTYLLQSK